MRTAKLSLLLMSALFISLVMGPVTPARTQTGPLVLAFYSAGYDMNTWGLPLPDSPVQSYISGEPQAVELHVVQAQRAGIDALVQFWQGPQREGNPTEFNLATLLDKSAAHGMKVAVALEVHNPLIQDVAGVSAALVALRDGHAQHPAYLRVAGRPVVFFHDQARYNAETWRTLRQEVDPQRSMVWIGEALSVDYLKAFDGFYYYSIAKMQDPVAVLEDLSTTVRQWSAAQGMFRYWVATVSPGYDDRALVRDGALVRERNHGSYYQTLWDGALRSSPDWIIINSFNGWLEGTQIEPSSREQDFYLVQTSYLTQAFRNLPPRPTPTFTPLPPTFTPTATPTLTATPTPSPTMATPTPEMSTATPEVGNTSDNLPPTATPFRLPTPLPTAAITATPTPEPGSGNGDPLSAMPSPTPTYSGFEPVTASPPPSSPCLPWGALFVALAGLGRAFWGRILCRL